MFVEDYVGGAELTTEAIIQGSLLPVIKIHCRSVTTQFMEKNKDKFWVFGNFSALEKSCLIYAIKNLKYSVLEYDYKFCKFRSPQKHTILSDGRDCPCDKIQSGKLVSIFYAHSAVLWFMSVKQKEEYERRFPFLTKGKVLSSVFSKDTLDHTQNLDCSKKNEKWLILDSMSWVKGRDASVKYAEQNNLEYELVWGLDHKELLKKMSISKGVIYLPAGADTCPRLTIEAKLLDCELIINKDVQHAEEPWFDSKETIIPYLKNRTDVFWSTLEEKWNLDTPKSKTISEQTKFNIIVPFYNAENWLEKCIDSVKRQRYNNFKCFLIDDLSSDLSSEVVLKNIKNDNRFQLIKNSEKKYALNNIIDTLIEHSTAEDVNILLDGDDWLASVNVLSFLNEQYSESDCLLTYGSYVYHPEGLRGVEPSMYSDEVINNNLFRKDSWRASHLRTFKTKLCAGLNLNDLKDSEGNFYKTAYDQALMLPLLELSGGKFKFVNHILHTYNRENPLNVDKIKQEIQFKTAQEVRRKKPYEAKN